MSLGFPARCPSPENCSQWEGLESPMVIGFAFPLMRLPPRPGKGQSFCPKRLRQATGQLQGHKPISDY